MSGQLQEHVFQIGRADGYVADGAVVLGGELVQGGQGGLRLGRLQFQVGAGVTGAANAGQGGDAI